MLTGGRERFLQAAATHWEWRNPWSGGCCAMQGTWGARGPAAHGGPGAGISKSVRAPGCHCHTGDTGAGPAAKDGLHDPHEIVHVEQTAAQEVAGVPYRVELSGEIPV